MDPRLLLAIVIGAGLLMAILTLRRRRKTTAVPLRPLPSYDAIRAQVGEAVESGNQLHITLGQASLASIASPTSIAALTVLDTLAREGCANATPPLVTVGEGTLLPAAQDSLLSAYNAADFTSGFEPGAAQFIAHDTDPFTYAGGVTSIIHRDQVSNNVAVGRFGSELALIAAAAGRENVGQVIGSDDPIALALATAATDQVLIGEELLVAGAYLEGKPGQIASLQTQDILRLLIILTILGLAIYQLRFFIQ